MSEQRRYLLGEGGASGIWLGLGAGRLGVLAGGVGLAVALVHSGAAAALGLLPILAAAGWCLLPVAGRSPHEWAGPVCHQLAGKLTGTDRWRTPLVALDSPALPAELGRLSITGVGHADQDIGVFVTRRGVRQGFTCVLTTVEAAGFPLADPAERGRLLDGWAATLTGLAAEHPGGHRLSWVQRAAPADPGAQRDWMRAQASPAGLGGMAIAEYEHLLERLAAQAVRVDTYLGVQIRRSGRQAARGTELAAAATRRVAASLLRAGVLTRPLAPDELAGLLGAWPGVTSPARPAAGGGRAGPASRRESWTQVRLDDTFHRSLLVTGWPRLPVEAAWLTPLLTAATPATSRTISLHFEHVAPAAAARRARAARINAEMEIVDRDRLGLLVDARRRRAQDRAGELDEELAAGHACHRVAGLVTVSAADLDSLEEACRTVITAAGTARLELRPLHGQHAAAWAASLPLGLLRYQRAP